LLLAYRLGDEVFAEVPHRQWVFTIPKRLRVYFRFDRSLLGKLCRAAYDTVCDVFGLEIDETVAASMRGWKYSGFSVDNSVKIEKGYCRADHVVSNQSTTIIRREIVVFCSETLAI
jgi:hypothetical protein